MTIADTEVLSHPLIGDSDVQFPRYIVTILLAILKLFTRSINCEGNSSKANDVLVRTLSRLQDQKLSRLQWVYPI